MRISRRDFLARCPDKISKTMIPEAKNAIHQISFP
jgi:hypothetical protein